MSLEVVRRRTFRKRLRNMQREGALAVVGPHFLVGIPTFAFVGAVARYLIWQVLVCRLRQEKVLQQ